MPKGRSLVSSLVLVVLLAAPAAATAKSTITLSGSTSVAPLVSQLARGYIKAKPGKAKFKLLQGGSDIGIADVARGRVTLGHVVARPAAVGPGRPGLQPDRA